VFGVPADLDLSPFQGAVLEQIALGPYMIQFRFAGDPEGFISVEGDWELVSPDGQVLDHQQPPGERTCYRLHVLLNREVVGFEVLPPEEFSLTFDSGHRLRIFDHSREYESFSIQPGNIFV